MLHADPRQRHLLVSTRNAHKVDEIREILGSNFIISDLSALSGFPEVEETGFTFQENATIKALAASGRFDGWVIADDSGLEVDALNGAPGIRSARFSGESSTDASNRSSPKGSGFCPKRSSACGRIRSWSRPIFITPPTAR